MGSRWGAALERARASSRIILQVEKVPRQAVGFVACNWPGTRCITIRTKSAKMDPASSGLPRFARTLFCAASRSASYAMRRKGVLRCDRCHSTYNCSLELV